MLCIPVHGDASFGEFHPPTGPSPSASPDRNSPTVCVRPFRDPVFDGIPQFVALKLGNKIKDFEFNFFVLHFRFKWESK